MAQEAKRRGRPPKEAEPGTRVSLGLKVTPAIKALIDERARASGRTQSQEVEAWIDQAKALNELGSAGPGVADALQAMARAALEVRNSIGDPTTSVAARDTLRQRWKEIAANAIPHVNESPAQSAALAAISAVRFAAIDAYGEVLRADPDDARLKRARAHLAAMSTAQLFPGSKNWPAAVSEFEAVADAEEGDLGDSLRVLLALADAAQPAVTRAERPDRERP